MQSRSAEPITAADLRRLAEIAREDRERMFATNPNWRPYQGRLIAVTLCQGAALHYLDRQTGVKDFDVWTFLEAIRRWLIEGRTLTARKLAEKAVVELEPVPGRVIWPPR